MSIITLTAANFDTEVLQSDKPVLIDFFATWCGPCKMLSPVVDRVAETAEAFKIGKVDIDQELELAQKYSVMSVPTLIVIKNGKMTAKSIGVISEQEIINLINK